MDSVSRAVSGNDALTETPSLHSSPRPTEVDSERLCPLKQYAESAVANELVDRMGYYECTPSEKKQHDDLVRTAYAVAYEAHLPQKRDSGEPYIDHPIEVARILIDLQLDSASVAAALLHDVLEDTRVSREQLQACFGEEVTYLVDGVTKLSKLENQSKEEAQAGTYRKMFIAMADDPRVVLVKLADRLHNMRTLGSISDERQRRNARETMDIYAPLAHRLGIWKIKWELEDRAFAVLEPEKFQMIRRQLNMRRDMRERTIQRVISQLERALEKEGIKADITGRPKHIYSIYRKMERKGVGLDQIYDQLAVRVIVEKNDVGECYRVLGIVHATWAPVQGEFDDYIATPKESLYQSLHTTVLIPGGLPCEVQIRTADMHQVAEHGIAAHWRYKEGLKRSESTFDLKLAWLRRLIEWRGHMTDAQEMVESIKNEELQDQVYVFTPKGRIVDLPLGSTPVDFAYRIHSEVGHRCVGAKVNNRLVPLDYQLQTGEMVSIMTSRLAPGPSHDWLTFVKTSGARKHIRTHFKKLHRDESITMGRELLERELRRLGLAQSFDSIAADMEFKSSEELFAQIGSGDVSANSIAQRLLARQVPIETDISFPTITPAPTQRSVTPSIRVGGEKDILTRLAKCCNPVAGEAIKGYVTRGKGVSIHRADCPVILKERDRERLIEVAWGTQHPKDGFPVPVLLEAWDRVGLWRDVAGAVADAGINIQSLSQIPTRKTNKAVLMATLQIHSIEQLSAILHKLNNLPGVIDARREDSAVPAHA